MIEHNDRNFDDLAHRFKRNVYGGLKGDIRLAVIQRDFAECLPGVLEPPNPQTAGAEKKAPGQASQPMRILDAGGGQGQLALVLAKAGHRINLCDISEQMLQLAADRLTAEGLADRVSLQHASIQSLAEAVTRHQLEPFDLVICHAVLEWVAEPQDLLLSLVQLTRPGGHLSLTYYNLNSLIYKNLLRTNFKKIKKREFTGYRGSLTPTNPLPPFQVEGWLSALSLKPLCCSGIRVFHDYIFNREDRERDPESLVEMELQFSRQEPYRSLGRYIHILARRVD